MEWRRVLAWRLVRRSLGGTGLGMVDWSGLLGIRKSLVVRRFSVLVCVGRLRLLLESVLQRPVFVRRIQLRRTDPGERPSVAGQRLFCRVEGRVFCRQLPGSSADIEHAIVDMPGNPDVHQFHSLIFFAMGDYQRAAAIAHTVLESGPGWDWSVLQSFYPSPEVYTQQLRALEHYITEHGDQAATRFLLGYQYMMLNHLSAARRQLERVVALEPRDKLAANILTGLNSAPGAKPQGLPGAMPSTGGPSGMPSTPPTPPGGPSAGGNPQGTGTANQVPTLPAPPSLPAGPSAGGGALTGTFTSSPAPDVKIELTLQPDKNFSWKFTQGGQAQSFDGTYVREGDSLVLTRKDGEKMDGTLKMRGDNSFQFRLKNTDPNDPGLEFGK